MAMRLFIGNKEVGAPKEFHVEDMNIVPEKKELKMPQMSMSFNGTAKIKDRTLIDDFLAEESYDVIIDRHKKTERIPRKIKKYAKWCIEHDFSYNYMYLLRCRRMVKFVNNILYGVILHHMQLSSLHDGSFELSGTQSSVNKKDLFILPKIDADILESILYNND